jgi:4-hydroxymandelate oxidase
MMPYEALRARALAVLPADVAAYVDAGAAEGRTATEAADAWSAWRLRPRTLRDVSVVQPTTTVLGTAVRAPVLVGPTAAHGLVHPDAERATAAGVRAAGSLLVVSTRAGTPVDAIATSGVPWWLQVYVLRDRGVSDALAAAAAAAGARALVLTVDTPYVARKPTAPDRPDPASALLRGLGIATTPGALLQAPDVTPGDITRLREVSGLPVVVKGVLRGDDAQTAVDAGAAGVVVSTHGGRQLDGVVPTAWALPEVVDAVGGGAEVYVDGGVRTGRDVLRALALGARAVLLGRAPVWALAVGGADGVRDLLDGMAADLVEALALAGCRAPSEAGRDLVWQATAAPPTVGRGPRLSGPGHDVAD